jgi:SNF family Na+-dependent transporter
MQRRTLADPYLSMTMFVNINETNAGVGLSPTTITNHHQTVSGRFRRSFDLDNYGNSLPTDKTSRSCSRGERMDEIGKVFYVAMVFVQGALCGLSIQTLYRSFVSQLMVNDNENRRLYFLAISMALTSCLCMIEKSPGQFETSDSSNRYDTSYMLAIVYFVALVITLSSSVVDTNAARDNDHMLTYRSSNSLEITRSVMCIIGWLISCYQIYRFVNNSRREKQAS